MLNVLLTCIASNVHAHTTCCWVVIMFKGGLTFDVFTFFFSMLLGVILLFLLCVLGGGVHFVRIVCHHIHRVACFTRVHWGLTEAI